MDLHHLLKIQDIRKDKTIFYKTKWGEILMKTMKAKGFWHGLAQVFTTTHIIFHENLKKDWKQLCL